MIREIIFRGIKKEDGQWIEGNYMHNKRKGEFHAIIDKVDNVEVYIYRESLQMKDLDGEFKDV